MATQPSGADLSDPRARLSTGRAGWLRGAGIAAFLAVAALPAPALAQALAHPLVPAGRVRFDFVPSVRTWDTRYGLRTDGASIIEEEESLGGDLTDPRGVSLFPGIATLEEAIRGLSGDAAWQANVGETTARLDKEVTRIDLGLHLGVFDWLTLGANLPYVRGRSTLDFAFRPSEGANLGLNPAFTGAPVLSDLFLSLGDAAVLANARAAELCGGGGGAACAEATALAGRTNGFLNGLLGAYLATPFFPLSGSDAATALQASLAALHADLAAAGLPGVDYELPFAAGAVDGETFARIPTDPSLGIDGATLRGHPGLWQLGDVELSAAVRILEGELRDSASLSPRLAWGLWGGFLVRLGTGLTDDPDVFLDLGSGDGQMDLEGRLQGALRWGSRLDLAGTFRYGRQGSLDLLRRVAPHERFLAPLASTRAVTWTPGAYTLLEVSPRLHLTEALSLSADLIRYHKAEDGFALASVSAEDDEVDLTVLSRETEATVQELAFGLRYSSLGLWRQGRVGTPAEVGLRLVRPLSGAGGQTPKASRVELSISLFRKIWG